jgi:predicted transglutaminase-like cysteine proteinase
MYQQAEFRTANAPYRTAEPEQSSSLKDNFFRAVARAVRCTKLGTLLLSSGLVSQGELDSALEAQKATGEPLGKILIRRGAVSAVALYRKLAEQWCLKASAAGMAVMMQAMAPTAAHAEDGITPTFQMAAANVNPAVYRAPAQAAREYPSLFGTQEVRSNDISAFKKWTGVMARFEEEMKTQGSAPRVMMWKAALQQLKSKGAREQIEGVNDYVNQVRYVEDQDNYGKSDYWATPVEFFSRGGDCEDFAIAKYASLRALGFSADQLRIAIVQDTWRNLPHAILIVYSNDGTFVLDNQDKNTETAQNVTRYAPIFSINSTSWWLHRRAVS